MHSFYNIRHVNQVYILYRGILKDGRYGVGHESSDAMLCTEAEIPWDQIAFPIIDEVLKLYFEDRRLAEFITTTKAIFIEATTGK